jgi:hypothetical protein
MDDHLDNGGDAEPPPPQFTRRQRDRPHAQADTKDGDVLENLTRRQIGDLLPVPPAVRARARARIAPRTPHLRLVYEGADYGATVFTELLEVVRKIESQ